MSTLAYAYESGYQDGLKAAGTEKAALGGAAFALGAVAAAVGRGRWRR